MRLCNVSGVVWHLKILEINHIINAIWLINDCLSLLESFVRNIQNSQIIWQKLNFRNVSAYFLDTGYMILTGTTHSCRWFQSNSNIEPRFSYFANDILLEWCDWLHSWILELESFKLIYYMSNFVNPNPSKWKETLCTMLSWLPKPHHCAPPKIIVYVCLATLLNCKNCRYRAQTSNVLQIST